MKVLREAGLLQHRREGTRCWVSLRSELSRDLPGLLDTVLGLAGKEPELDELIDALSRKPQEVAVGTARYRRSDRNGFYRPRPLSPHSPAITHFIRHPRA